MEPTLLPADHMLVNKLCYDLKLPFTDLVLAAPGDAQTGRGGGFKNPQGQGPDFVKRIVGLPGETVEMRGDIVYINGRPLGPEWGRYTRRSHQGITSGRSPCPRAPIS